MTLLTEKVLEQFRASGPVEFVNWSVATTRRSLFTRLRYVNRYLNSVLRLLWTGRAFGKRLYMTANSRSGLYWTAILVFVASRLGYRVYLHHHVYSYITTFDRRVAWTDKWMGPNGVHVVHSEKMADDFRKQYHSSCGFAVLLPSAVTLAIAHPHPFPKRSFRIGMLSNLTLEKGVGRTIDSFEQLCADGRQVELMLAGPLIDPRASALIQQARKQHGNRVTYCGAVYGDQKSKFFAQLDAFLFPTKYPRESWGIVLNESLAAGVPVITIDRGCTSSVVANRAGLVVDNSADFVKAAVAQLSRWLDQPHEYEAASRAAIERADFLNAEGQSTLEKLAKHMFSPLDSIDGLLPPP